MEEKRGVGESDGGEEEVGTNGGIWLGGGVWDSDGQDLMSRAFIIVGFLVILLLLF